MVEERHVVCAEEGGEEGELFGREVELVLLTERPRLLRLVVAVERDVPHDRELIRLVYGHVLRINDRRDVHLLGNVLGVLNQLVATRLAVGLVYVDEVRLELADQLAQRVAVVPVRAQVLDLVLKSLPVDPLEQHVLRRVRLVSSRATASSGSCCS